MSDNKRKKLAALVLYAGVIALVLTNKFNRTNVIIGIVVTLIMLIKTFVTSNKKSDFGLTKYWGDYIGSFIVFTMIVGLISDFELTEKSAINYGAALIMAPFAVVLLIFLIAFNRKKENKYIISKYIILYLGILIMFICNSYFVSLEIKIINEEVNLWDFVSKGYIEQYSTGTSVIYLAVLIFTLTFFAIEVTQRKLFQIEKIGTFTWAYAISYIYIFEILAYPEYILENLKKVGTLYSLIQWKIPYILIIIVGFMAMAAYTSCVDKGKGRSYDTRIVIATFAHVIVIPFSIANYSPYISLLYLSLLLLDILIIYNKDKVFQKSVFNSQNVGITWADLLYIIGVIILFVLYNALLNGIADLVILLIASVFVLIKMYKRDEGNIKIGFSESVLILLMIFASDWCWHWHNNLHNYIYIITIGVIFSIVLFILNINKHNVDAQVAVICVLIMAGILLLFTGRNSGVKVNVAVKDSVNAKDIVVSEMVQEKRYIQVQVRPKGKDNKVEKIYYYWNNDKKSVKNVEIDGNDSATIPFEKGKLSIYAEDSYGVSSRNIKIIN